MAEDLVLEYTRNELKDEKATAEIACIAPVLGNSNFRSLLGTLVTRIKEPLLHVQALEGLGSIIQSTPPGSMDPDDLIRVLKNVQSCLEVTYKQSSDHVYRLTRTVSHILDAMVDDDIKELDRVKLHAPLLEYSRELQKSEDPYMVFQAAYAYQALLRIPDDEQKWQAVLRHTGAVVMGTARLFSAVKSFHVESFIETIHDAAQVASTIFTAVGGAYKDFIALKKSGHDLLKALKTSFDHKRAWYPMLRGIDILLRNGELTKVKAMICNAPCRLELAFQWGVCLRLGNLAADPMWDADSQEGAVAFLGEIYRNDTDWGREAKVKQCILDILMQLASESGRAKLAAESLLQEFAQDVDLAKRALYDASRKEGPSSLLMKVASPLLSSSPLLDRVQKIPVVDDDLRKLACDRLEWLEDTIYIAPEAKPNRQAPDGELFDLTTKVKEFLDGNKKVFLILGDSGAGKSTFNKELERELWKDYMDCKDQVLKGQKKIPIFVSLPAVDRTHSDLVGRQLREAGFSKAQIKELKAKRRFVLICDGYDEQQEKRNLYDINRLNQPGKWKAQMVISCRSEYLSHSYHYLFQPEDRDHQMDKALFQEAAIAPFSMERIQAYIEKYVAKEGSPLKVKDYLREFDRIPGLQELVTNPFLLTLCLRVLPDMTNFESHGKITRLMLYDKFIDHWVEKGKRRLIKRSLPEGKRKAFDILSDDDFSQSAIRFMKELAVAILKYQNGAPVVEYFHDREYKTWKAAFFGHEDHKIILREVCPLNRELNRHRFIHQSVFEYAMARAVFEPQQGGYYGTAGQGTTTVAQERSERQAVDGDTSIIPVRFPDMTSPLYWAKFVDKPAVLQFLADRVVQEPAFKEQLYNFIDCSRTDERWCIAAANAITILVRAGVRFNGEDLQGIQIPGADLSRGEFDSAQLQGADLRDTNLRNIWLRQANLSNARMSGAKFGESPYLQEPKEVLSCSYSPDGGSFCVGLSDGKIIMYDTTSWLRIWHLRGHSLSITSVAYSPSGHQIATGSHDRTVRLRDARTGVLGPTLRGHTDFVTSVTYSLRGQLVVSGSRDGLVWVWNSKTGKLDHILRGHTHKIHSVAFSPTGNRIASGSKDKTVRLWSSLSNQPGLPVLTLTGHLDAVTSVAYSPSGHQIASGSRDRSVRLWDAETGALISKLTGHTSWITSVKFSPSGHQIASGSYDSTVRLWDARTGASGPILSGHTKIVNSVAYSPRDFQIASGSSDMTVRLWDTKTDTHGPILDSHSRYVSGLIYLPTGRQIIRAEKYTSGLWDTWTASRIRRSFPDKKFRVVYSPSGHPIALRIGENTVRLWDAQTDAFGHILSGHTGRVNSMVYSPSGRQIASGSSDKTVRLWDSQTGAAGLILRGHTGGVLNVMYSPNGLQIASNDEHETIRLWDVQTGTHGPVLRGYIGRVAKLLYSPNGRQIASGGVDEVVRLWNTETGALDHTLRGHTDDITDVEYSPNGHQIASASKDGTVRLWNAQTGARGHILGEHYDDVYSVTYSPSGHRIISKCSDYTLRLWDVDSGQCLFVLDDETEEISGVVWNRTFNEIFVRFGDEDSKYLRIWRIIEEEGHYRKCLLWRSKNDKLQVSNTSIQDTQGLSGLDIQLLKQRGAVGEPISSSSLQEQARIEPISSLSSREQAMIEPMELDLEVAGNPRDSTHAAVVIIVQ
ncbi:hypothetical protein BGZ98_008958 [Dissophora globulifera]|nr:hypothetical protein BGZ98_008958 [Dissophora globulifera]